MSTVLSQSIAVIKMNVLSLPRRIWMSLAMMFASGVVVAILLAFLSMSKGFEKTLQSAGSEDIAIYMRKGSAAELNSSISKEHINIIQTTPEILSNDKGPIISSELYVIVDGIKKTTQTEANIPLRGLSEQGVSLRSRFQLVEGRMFTPGTNELIVGQGVINQFDGFALGNEIRFGKYRWHVVGVFTTGGDVFESELWTDAKVVQNLYNRTLYQTARARISSPSDIDALRAFVENDARLNLDVQTEADYFAEQGKSLSYMAIFGKVISSVMALGAIAGALNTMYTSVADRAKEIATLRAIGFSNLSAFIGTMAEALFLATLGGVIGTFAAFFLFDGMSASTLGGSFTQVVFSFELSTDLIIQGVFMALVIGFISGIFPAWRAAKMPVVVAFQS